MFTGFWGQVLKLTLVGCIAVIVGNVVMMTYHDHNLSFGAAVIVVTQLGKPLPLFKRIVCFTVFLGTLVFVLFIRLFATMDYNVVATSLEWSQSMATTAIFALLPTYDRM